jgi:hypothetical protein
LVHHDLLLLRAPRHDPNLAPSGTHRPHHLTPTHTTTLHKRLGVEHLNDLRLLLLLLGAHDTHVHVLLLHVHVHAVALRNDQGPIGVRPSHHRRHRHAQVWPCSCCCLPVRHSNDVALDNLPICKADQLWWALEGTTSSCRAKVDQLLHLHRLLPSVDVHKHRPHQVLLHALLLPALLLCSHLLLHGSHALCRQHCRACWELQPWRARHGATHVHGVHGSHVHAVHGMHGMAMDVSQQAWGPCCCLHGA